MKAKRFFGLCFFILFALLQLPADDLKSAVRRGQSVTVLPDGGLLLLGGFEGENRPVLNAFVATGSGVRKLATNLQVARAGHTATVLPDGTVFIFGGVGADGQIVAAAELYDPSTQSFSVLADVLAVPRAFHTATLLIDGTVLLAGGIESGREFPDDVQHWDFRTRRALSQHALLLTPREGHTANLLSDGNVRVSGGTDLFGRPVILDEIYDPNARRFRFANQGELAEKTDADRVLKVAVSIPEDGATGVSIQGMIALRFTRPLNVATVNANNFVLVGPNDKPIGAKVTGAENGRLAFVLPAGPLRPGTNYALRISNAADSHDNKLDSVSISFTTEGEPAEGPGSEDDRSQPATSRFQQLPPLRAAPGETALSGQVLKLNGWPLERVTLEIDGNKARTDDTGRFLMKGLVPGHHVLWIDAATANHDEVRYGVYEVGATIQAGKTNVLNYTIWMTKLDTAHAVNIPSPTTGETVITHPGLPGLELHLPPGTVITDRYGKVVHQVGITPIPLDKTPFPLPAGVDVPIYFTIQPGGAYIKVLNPGSGPKGARLFYPNGFHLSPGSPFMFWNYDASVRGWYVYGSGHVAPDARNIIPDPGVAIYEFTGAMGSGKSAGGLADPAGNTKDAGEPVSLSTGQFIYTKTDLALPDTIPITFSRTYNTIDSFSRSFGVGFTDSYDIFLVADIFPYTFQDLILNDGARIHFDRISPGTSFLDAVYVHASAQDAFYGAKITWVGDSTAGIWRLVMKDGSSFVFPEASSSTNPFCQAPTQFSDRYGNTVQLQRAAKSNNPTGCQLLKIVSPNGRFISLTHDAQGRITQAQDNLGRSVTYTYDAAGRLATVTDAGGGVTTYAYSDQNQMVTIQDARGIVYLTNQYDSTGRVIQQTQADGSTYLFSWTPTLNTTQQHFSLIDGGGGGGGVGVIFGQSGCWGPGGYARSDSKCGQGYLPLVAQVDVTDPRGYVERVVFNQYGYATSDTHALGQPEQQTVTYQYYSDNLLQSVTDALNRATTFSYDADGHAISVTRLAGTGNAVTTTFAYGGPFGQLSSTTDPLGHTSSFSYDQLGNLVAATDPLGHQTTVSYNGAGQPASVTDALNHTVQLGYFGGDLVSVTDPLGNVSTLVTDAVGRVIASADALGNTSKSQYSPLNLLTQVTDPQGHNTAFAYDANGNLLTLTDALNHTTSYTYDNMDRALTRTDPLNRQERYSYDLNGNLVSSTDRKGQVTSVTYDPLNRVKLLGYNTVVSGGNTTYESTVSYTYDAGDRMTQVVDTAGGTITEGYDNLDRLTSEATALGSISYGYDAADRQTSMTVAGQPAVTYTYDNANRLTQIARSTATTGFGYDNANRRTSLTLPNGVAVSYNYDNGSRLTGITYYFGSNTLGGLTYAYDQLGRRTQVGGSFARTGLPGAIASTAYDAANELLNWNGTAISYDLNGNMLSDGSHTFTWNARNQVASLNGVNLQYDAAGRRIKNAAGTSFLYNGANPVQELSGSTVTANLLSGGVDEIFTRTDSSGAFTPLKDALGSTIALVDSSGNVQTSYTYDPFGGTSVTGSSNANEFQYTGRENEGNGLYYYRARYYSPSLGRFINEDPIGFGGGLNFYSYVFDSPTNLTDASGNCPTCTVPAPVAPPLNPSAEAVEEALKAVAKSTARAAASGGEAELGAGFGAEVETGAAGGPVGLAALAVAASGVTAYYGASATAAEMRANAAYDASNQAIHNLNLLNLARAQAQSLAGRSCGNGGKGDDPCKGLRDQLASHEQKLRDYSANPYAHDNKGILGQGRDEQIIAGRTRNLQKQIDNFRRLLEECEREHGLQ